MPFDFLRNQFRNFFAGLWRYWGFTIAPTRKWQRLSAYTAVTALALRHTIHRMMIEDPIRPFDWWMLAIEVGVLVLVAYEVGMTITHQILSYGGSRPPLRRITLFRVTQSRELSTQFYKHRTLLTPGLPASCFHRPFHHVFILRSRSPRGYLSARPPLQVHLVLEETE